MAYLPRSLRLFRPCFCGGNDAKLFERIGAAGFSIDFDERRTLFLDP